MTFSLFPHAICQTRSRISGEIVVKEQFGQHKLYVQGTLQSGGIVRNIWKKPIKKLQNSKIPELQNVLILGLGGGTVVQLIKQRWPKAKIVGVEIDPEITKIGKKNFGLSQIENLKIIQADAFEWVTDCLKNTSDGVRRDGGLLRGGRKNKLKNTSEVAPPAGGDSSDGGEKSNKAFDLIIIDLYLGKKFPKKAKSEKFLENIQKLLTKEGVAIFNRLKTEKAEIKDFEKRLEKIFSEIQKVKATTNVFFLAR